MKLFFKVFGITFVLILAGALTSPAGIGPQVVFGGFVGAEALAYLAGWLLGTPLLVASFVCGFRWIYRRLTRKRLGVA
jgi:hypothetical protein